MTPIKQRKNPVERAFKSRLVGMPQDEPEVVPPPESPEPTKTPAVDAPKRRGRPPKSDKAMSGRERTQRYRQAQQVKLEDKERRDLVAQLVKIYRWIFPFADLKSPLAHKVLAERRQRLQKIHDEWVLLPVGELRKTLQTYEENKDSQGRLHGESSGEADRKNGMSGVEQRIAEAESQQSSGHDDDSGRGRGGDASQNYNIEQEPGSARPPRGARIPKEHIYYLDGREDIITELVGKHARPEAGGVRCLLCQDVQESVSPEGVRSARYTYPVLIPDSSDVRQHFWEEYDKGLRLFYRYQELSEDPAVVEMAQFIVADARKAYLSNKHLQEVWQVSRERQAKLKDSVISSQA